MTPVTPSFSRPPRLPGGAQVPSRAPYQMAAGRPQDCPAAVHQGPGDPFVPSGTPSGYHQRRVCGPRPRLGSCRRGCRPRPPPPLLPHRASCAAAAAGAGARPRAGCRKGPTRRPAVGGSGWPRRSQNSPASRRLRRPRPRDFPERPSCRRGHCWPAAGSPRERVSAKPAARTHSARRCCPSSLAWSPLSRRQPPQRHRPAAARQPIRTC